MTAEPARRLRTMAVMAGVVLVLSYAAVCAVLYLLQRSFVFFPDRALAGTPADVGLQYEPVRLRTADGLDIAGWWIPVERPRGAVVFAHGNAGNVSHRLEELRVLEGLGVSVLAFDYRGYGKSGGRPSERGTYRDMDAAIDFVTRERGFPLERILFLGESLGGAVAVEAASRRRVGGLILESTFTSVRAMARLYYPWLPASLLVTIRYDSLSRMSAVSCPVLVLHSPDDDIVPYSMGRELFAAARAPKAFADLVGGHNGGGIAASSDARSAVDAFLALALAP